MNKTAVTQQAKTASFLPPVQGLLQRKCACGNYTVAGGECAECGKNKSRLQRKLTIGASNDPLELEADRVADQVMATPTHSTTGRAPLRIQRFAGQATEGVETAPASVDRILASSGRPLESGLRQDMEQRFGHDFSRVRVHSGAAAEQSAKDVNANAYTVGHNIVFGAGRFAPETHGGRRLVAHELTHVVQQSGVDGNSVSQSNEKRGLPLIPIRLQRDGKQDRGKAGQKKPAIPTLAQRLDVVEKQQKVAGLDAEWHPTFRERMESYSAALWRISGAIEIANKGFEAVQQKQAQFEQLIAQIIGGTAGVIFAAGFEWAFSKAAGLLSKNTKKIEKIVETVENPFNAAVSAGINIYATTTAAKSAERGQAPSIGSTPLAFLSDNFEVLHTQAQGIEQAFAKRAAKTTKFSDKQWIEFDIEVQRAIYEKLYEEIVTTASGIEQLKQKDKMAKIFEKLIWAYWLRNLNNMRGAYGAAVRPRPGAAVGDNLPNVGTEIERRLTEIGISAEAGIKLSGHWYKGNSNDWQPRLLEWASTYFDTISVSEVYVPSPKTKQGDQAA